MKLRVRVNKQTSRLELEGEELSLTDLCIQIKEILLPSCGLSPDTEFTLSLNGKEPLSDLGQSLSSCGIVSGDLICVILPHSDPPVSSAPPAPRSSSSADPPHKQRKENRPPPAQRLVEASTSHGGIPMQEAEQEVDAKEAEQEVDAKEAEHGSVAGPYIPEPMLCSESEHGMVPNSLEVLHHGAQIKGASDSLVVAMHLLMVETGFVPQDQEAKAGKMPAGWRAEGGVYRLQYSHPLCEHILAVLVAVPMGNMLVTNATLKMNGAVDNARKLLLKLSSYVTEERVAAGGSAADVYRDLKKLSRIFRDQLVYPLIASARQAMNLPAVFGLTALPPELLLRVLRLLDVASVVTLSGVCRDLHATTADLSLWRHLYHRDFRDSTSRPRETDWKDLYKKKYKQRGEVRFRRTRLFPPIPPQPMPFHPSPFGPNPHYPPGIIGGEYDQRVGIPFSILPSPRFDPIGPQPGRDLRTLGPIGRRPPGASGNRSSDIRRGFI